MRPEEIWSQTPLHTAAIAGDGAAVERILVAGGGGTRAGADLEARDVLGFTALHAAACEGQVEIVERLLAAGAVVDARADDGLTPLMLAVARGHLAIVDALLAAGADANAEGSVSAIWTMRAFATRGASLPVLERLVAAGFAPTSQELTKHFRLVLELTGHRVRFAERGYCRGIAGDTDDVWVVDRRMTVPASLMAPMAATHPSLAYAAGGLADAADFYPWYGAKFVARPTDFDAVDELDDTFYQPGVPATEIAHEVRCGRQGVVAPSGPNGWSPFARIVSGERQAIVLAMVRTAGWDPAAIAAESDQEAAARMEQRGIYPVHLAPLRELLAQGLSAERQTQRHDTP